VNPRGAFRWVLTQCMDALRVTILGAAGVPPAWD
jgi:hypothetical protein